MPEQGIRDMQSNVHWKGGALLTLLLLTACGRDHRSAPPPAAVADSPGARQDDPQLGSRRHANRRGASANQARITRTTGRHATAGPGSTSHR